MENKTLFSYYKRMINNMWEEGFRKYTANELNTFVGSHEKSTQWKRYGNNPYYSTRSYQTELRRLGCITPIKRGLWQINGPIPEWFGSFHIKGLRGGFDPNNKYADHSCFYWNNLDPKYKINPWRNIDPMRVMASIGPLDLNNPTDRAQYINNKNTQNMTQRNFTTTNSEVEKTCQSYSVDFNLTAPFGAQFKCHAYVNKVLTMSNDWEVEVGDLELTLLSNKAADHVAIRNLIYLMMGETEGINWLKSVDDYVKELVQNYAETTTHTPTSQAVGLYTKEQVHEILQSREVYTKEQVHQILKDFIEFSRASVKSEVEDALDNLDVDDAVQLDFDSYNRSINVEFNSRQISSNLVDGVDEGLSNALNDFNIENTDIK